MVEKYVFWLVEILLGGFMDEIIAILNKDLLPIIYNILVVWKNQ